MPTTNSLGNGQYRVLIQTRCGNAYLFELHDLLEVSFNRVLNDISSAEVTVGFRQCDLLSVINPWQHEIAIFRNDVLVWVGPIIEMTFDQESEKVSISAKDLLTWADHRLVELANVDYDPDSTDLTDAYVWLLEHAYCKDPWCMTWSVDPVGIPVTRYYPSFAKSAGERWGGAYVTCGEEMRSLSGSGVDFTVVNRHLWGGATQVVNPVASGIVLLDQHFHLPPVVKVAGSKMATRFVSAGGQGGYGGYYDDQISMYPATSGPITPLLLDETQSKYGLLESFNTIDIYDDVDTTSDPNPVAQDAKSRWDLLHQPYVYVDEGSLSDEAPLTFNRDLIPGAVYTVLLSESCRAVSEGLVRLREVNVSSSGEREEVRVSLSPLGTTTS
jgi:hypothetical protein